MNYTLSQPQKRYLIIGLTVYGFELVVIVLAQQLGASPVLAVALSFSLGFMLSFGLQKVVTFGDHRLHHRILVPQLLAALLLVLFNFGFSLAMTRLLERWLPAVVIRSLALGITTIWNYRLYKTHIFRASGDEPVVY